MGLSSLAGIMDRMIQSRTNYPIVAQSPESKLASKVHGVRWAKGCSVGRELGILDNSCRSSTN